MLSKCNESNNTSNNVMLKNRISSTWCTSSVMTIKQDKKYNIQQTTDNRIVLFDRENCSIENLYKRVKYIMQNKYDLFDFFKSLA